MRAGAAEATTGEDGCAHPNSFSMMLRLSTGTAGRATATSGRDAWRSGLTGWVGVMNSGGRGGGKGKLSVSPTSGKSRPGGSGRLPACGIAGAAAEGKGSKLGSGKGAVEAGGAASRLATCCDGAADLNSASRLASMTMSPKGREMAGAAKVVAGLHREKSASGPAGPSQCNAQAATAPARATAATPGRILEPAEDYPRPQTKGRRMLRRFPASPALRLRLAIESN